MQLDRGERQIKGYLLVRFKDLHFILSTKDRQKHGHADSCLKKVNVRIFRRGKSEKLLWFGQRKMTWTKVHSIIFLSLDSYLFLCEVQAGAWRNG